MWGYSVVSHAGNLKNVNGIMKENYVLENLESCARRLDLETVGNGEMIRPKLMFWKGLFFFEQLFFFKPVL